MQFRHGSGAIPELSVRIAQTQLRVPALKMSNGQSPPVFSELPQLWWLAND
jgi:hypothetical protein